MERHTAVDHATDTRAPDTAAAVIDLDHYPLDRPDSPEYRHLVDRCRTLLDEAGMFDLEGFVRPEAIARTVEIVAPRMATESSTQRRWHNAYFLPHVPGVPPDHPALAQVLTINHTLCGDQLLDTPLTALYEWAPLRRFVADTMCKADLHLMDDPLARANVMSYRPGEALNWHFDRSEFTVTVLLQAAEHGGLFEHRFSLRSDDDPNYDGVGRAVAGHDPDVQVSPLDVGALNVFRGRNTLHRVSTVEGARERLVAVLSYYEQPGVRFSDEENLGFYGRTAT